MNCPRCGATQGLGGGGGSVQMDIAKSVLHYHLRGNDTGATKQKRGATLERTSELLLMALI